MRWAFSFLVNITFESLYLQRTKHKDIMHTPLILFVCAVTVAFAMGYVAAKLKYAPRYWKNEPRQPMEDPYYIRSYSQKVNTTPAGTRLHTHEADLEAYRRGLKKTQQ